MSYYEMFELSRYQLKIPIGGNILYAMLTINLWVHSELISL